MTNKEILTNALMIKAKEMRDLISQNMESKGNVESDCQQLCLLNRLNDFECTVNGIDETDMKYVGKAFEVEVIRTINCCKTYKVFTENEEDAEEIALKMAKKESFPQNSEHEDEVSYIVELENV